MNVKVFNHLANELFNIFASRTYTSDKELQKDFAQFKLDNLGRYHRVLDYLLEEFGITWREAKIHPNRWHLCKHCNRPFIATDKFNKQEICKLETYSRYGTNGFYKSTGKSVCFMQNKAALSKKYKKVS